MKLYGIEAGKGYVVKNYGEGLMMIKPRDGQGRCLFFCTAQQADVVSLVALLAYKKETTKLPDRVKDLAMTRMRMFKEKLK